MTKNVLFPSIPPIPCCSCVRVRRKHSQYTRDTYFWHSKVMAERQAFNLCAAFGEKGVWCPFMCATFQQNEKGFL